MYKYLCITEPKRYKPPLKPTRNQNKNLPKNSRPPRQNSDGSDAERRRTQISPPLRPLNPIKHYSGEQRLPSLKKVPEPVQNEVYDEIYDGRRNKYNCLKNKSSSHLEAETGHIPTATVDSSDGSRPSSPRLPSNPFKKPLPPVPPHRGSDPERNSPSPKPQLSSLYPRPTGGKPKMMTKPKENFRGDRSPGTSPSDHGASFLYPKPHPPLRERSTGTPPPDRKPKPPLKLRGNVGYAGPQKKMSLHDLRNGKSTGNSVDISELEKKLQQRRNNMQ